MMHAIRILFVFTALLIFSCTSNEETPTPFYPAASFFIHEIKQIDSLPVAVFHITSEHQHSDTSIFSKEELKKMSSSFFIDELKKMDADHGFKEVVLHDEQLKETTLSYSKENPTTGLSKVELHIKDGETAIHLVYIERMDATPSVERFRKILWRTGKEMIIQTVAFSQGKEVENRTDHFVWSIEP